MAEWISVTEAAQLLGYTTKHIRRLAAGGKIKAQRFANLWQIDRRSLLAYVKAVKKLGEKRGPKGIDKA
jgi:excisionase family DNA binding protein